MCHMRNWLDLQTLSLTSINAFLHRFLDPCDINDCMLSLHKSFIQCKLHQSTLMSPNLHTEALLLKGDLCGQP